MKMKYFINMHIIFISEYQVERGEERGTMMRAMGQSQVLETNNMSTLIFFHVQR